MSELTLFLIRVAYLAILWIFVLSAISVIRSDMFGARLPATAREAAAPKARRQPKQKARKGSPTHVLVVPRNHYANAAEVAVHEPGTTADLLRAAARVAAQDGVESYRLVFNTGADANQTVFHAHLHVLGVRRMGWPPG